MLIYCSIMVKNDTRAIRDVDILQYYGKIRHRPVRDVVIMQYYGDIHHPSSQGLLVT